VQEERNGGQGRDEQNCADRSQAGGSLNCGF